MRFRVLALAALVLLAGCGMGIQTPGPWTPTDSPTATDSVPTRTVPPSATPPADGLQATVVEVVDGDTVKVKLENGSRDTVRLLGIDTPEVHTDVSPDEFEDVPDTPAGRQCLREWGERASSYTKERLLGKTVTLTFDENEPRRGYYDRLLAYVTVDGSEFNYAMISQGYARVYDSQFVRRARYDDAEAVAQDQRRGVWDCATGGSGTDTPGGTATDTPGGTATDAPASPIEVVTVHADAAGRDGENLNDEYVTLTNTGDSAVDLSGATLTDAADHTYTFPDGFTLDPGESVTVHTGSGTDTATDLYWGAGSPVWNNGGDTLTLRSADGDVLVRYSYG